MAVPPERGNSYRELNPDSQPRAGAMTLAASYRFTVALLIPAPGEPALPAGGTKETR